MNGVPIYTNRHLRVERRKRVPTQTGTGHTHVADGYEEITYCVSLDVRRVEMLARRAAGSKRGKAVAGPIVVQIVARRPAPL